jgi:outer membrane protein TolC
MGLSANSNMWRLAAAALVFAATACGRDYYSKEADLEVYRILDSKRQSVPMLTGSVKIVDPDENPLAEMPTTRPAAMVVSQGDTPDPVVAEILAQEDAENSEPVVILSLTGALKLAAVFNRDYQSNRESVYLAGLDLSLERHSFDPIYAGIVGGDFDSTPVEMVHEADFSGRVARDVAQTLINQTLSPTSATLASNAIPAERVTIHHDNSIAGNSDFSMTRLLSGGGQVALNVATEALQFLTGDARRAAGSVLSLDFLQPLLRGAGKSVVQENLTQRERDVIYELRTFARFRQTFAVSVASQYYRVLQNRTVMNNNWEDFLRNIDSRKRSEMLAEAGRLPQFQADQARQAEFRAKNGWISARQNYQQSLDNFKISLGLPTDTRLELDPRELDVLAEAGTELPNLSRESAIEIALRARMDLLNDEDRVDDVTRQVEVTANALESDLTISGSVTVPTAGPTQMTKFRLDQSSFAAGLAIDLPLERKAERNAYRTSLINLDRLGRAFSLAVDNVKLDVRRAWRELGASSETLVIQKNSLALAQRRVDSTNLLLEAGRAQQRDLLESQGALVDAQNGVTRALVDYTIARLELWRDIGILSITPKGLWEEPDYEFNSIN